MSDQSVGWFCVMNLALPCAREERWGAVDIPCISNSVLPQRQWRQLKFSLCQLSLLITSKVEEKGWRKPHCRTNSCIAPSLLRIVFKDHWKARMSLVYSAPPLIVASVGWIPASALCLYRSSEVSCVFPSLLTSSFFFLFSLPPQMESPVSTPAPPPLHLLSTVGSSEIASPCEQIMVRTRSVAVNTSDVALATEPECLGPCEPGTSVNLEGIVWQETEDGKRSSLMCFWGAGFGQKGMHYFYHGEF